MKFSMPLVMESRSLVLTVALSALAVCLGCGSNMAIVEGSVTFDGQPVEQGTIVFEPADGTGAVAGGTIQKGKYRLGPEANVVPGDKIVRISAMQATGKKIKAGPPAPDDAMVDEVKQYIPTVYNQNSKLTAAIVAGTSTQNFDLRSQ